MDAYVATGDPGGCPYFRIDNIIMIGDKYLKPSIWTKISGRIAKAVSDNIKASRDIKETADSVTFNLFGKKCIIKFIIE